MAHELSSLIRPGLAASHRAVPADTVHSSDLPCPGDNGPVRDQVSLGARRAEAGSPPETVSLRHEKREPLPLATSAPPEQADFRQEKRPSLLLAAGRSVESAVRMAAHLASSCLAEMAVSSLGAVLAAAPAAGVAEVGALATSPRTNEVVRDAVIEVLRQHKDVEFIGVGSHVSGINYRDPVAMVRANPGVPIESLNASDHDFRLILPGEQDLGRMEARYASVRNDLASALEQKLSGHYSPDEIKAIQYSVNLYPPDDLTTTIATDPEAIAFFQARGLNPNLGQRPVDGLWGENARTWINHYERRAGQLYFMEGDVVRVGATDLTHLVEEHGYGRLTAEGTANLAGQFADKGLDALGERKFLDVYKDLKRLDESLARSRRLAMVPESGRKLGEVVQRLKDIENTCTDPTKRYQELVVAMLEDEDVIRTELRTAKAEAAVLNLLHEPAGGARKAFYRSLLANSGEGPWSKAIAEYREQFERLDVGQLLDFVARFGAVVDLVVDSFAGTGDRNQAYERVQRMIEVVGGGLVVVSAAMMDSILQGAMDAGIRVAAGAQNGENLIGGIYSAWGAQDVQDSPLNRTIAQIVTEFPDTSDGRRGIENLVRLHAHHLAEGHSNPDPAFREKLESAAVAKCLPEVMGAWRAARREEIEEINRLMLAVGQGIESGSPSLVLDGDGTGSISVPADREPPLGVRASVSGRLPRSLEAMATDLRRARDLAFHLDHNAPLDNSHGGQHGDHFPLSFDLASIIRLQRADGRVLGQQEQRLNPCSKDVLVPPALTATVNEFGQYRADLVVSLHLTALPISDDLQQISLLANPSQAHEARASLDLEVVRLTPDGLLERSLDGAWNVTDSRGDFDGAVDLHQEGTEVSGTQHSRYGDIPVTGSLSDDALHLVFHFGTGALGRVLHDADLARKVGSVTATADLELDGGHAQVHGVLTPFNIHYDAETGAVTEVYSGGREDPSNPSRPFTLARL